MLGEVAWKVYRNSMYYLCNFSLSLKLFQYEKVKTMVRIHYSEEQPQYIYSLGLLGPISILETCIVSLNFGGIRMETSSENKKKIKKKNSLSV